MAAVAPVIRIGAGPSSASLQYQADDAAKTTYKNLSPFQVEKFNYLFDAIFDLDKNEMLESPDILALAEKMREYSGWDKNNEHYKSILDTQYVFLECLQDQVRKEMAADANEEVIPDWSEAVKAKQYNVESITRQQWLNMWGRLVYGSAGMSDFPCWVQVLPTIFFTVIDGDKDGVISLDEYTRFYRDFVGIKDPKQLTRVANEGYRALTAGGDYKLTRENFNFCFANFLLGTSIYGPGKYIFGVFDNRDMDESYKVSYNEED